MNAIEVRYWCTGHQKEKSKCDYFETDEDDEKGYCIRVSGCDCAYDKAIDEALKECVDDRHYCKRKPDPDGVLELTSEEYVQLNSILKYNFNVTKVRLTSKHIRAFGEGDRDREIIDEYKAILWLAERFELVGKPDRLETDNLNGGK